MNCFTVMNVRLTGLLLASFVILVPAMYFDLGEQEEKCIIEEIPEDTLVSGLFYCNQEREEKFRQMSEDTNGNVLWWAIIQTSILLSVGIWQMKNLKNFLIEKKLV
ncbi:transmembrane emp24 domain-containing protein 11-like [Carassius gibelio]|uniref:transmembrane emp24 domain-containing protein 11-like n=1 Tax=Carassius gibelio TaxID=101364 RepID=UPI0022787E18|nr:transmembrane emp24 domain-containing protein 11-like [Carassius gibelio]